MSIFKKNVKEKISVYEKAFFDSLFKTLEISHADNILEITTDAKYIDNDIFEKYAPYVDKTTDIANVEGGIFDKIIIINMYKNVENILNIARLHSDGNIVFIYTKLNCENTLEILKNLNPINLIISKYSVFIF